MIIDGTAFGGVSLVVDVTAGAGSFAPPRSLDASPVEAGDSASGFSSVETGTSPGVPVPVTVDVQPGTAMRAKNEKAEREKHPCR